MTWVDVAAQEDVPAGQMLCRQVNGQRVLLANNGERFFACDEMCSHEDFSLCYGALQGERIKCSLHGSRFDLNTGEPLDDPADAPIRVFKVKLENGRIWVSM